MLFYAGNPMRKALRDYKNGWENKKVETAYEKKPELYEKDRFFCMVRQIIYVLG